jgi:ubiquitin-activating enzyme E1 C
VIGAGGLGCELLKDLALTGFSNIHVIDMDTIDLSNLNRQFLFRKSDIGKPKATAAADFINRRVPSCTVTPHFAKIQDFDCSFYAQFHVIVSGLDSVSARRWINGMLVSMLDYDEQGRARPETIKPLIDGGTEGFKGNVRVIYPGMNACVECTLDLFPPQVNFPLCTIAHTPRLPEHCIEYAKILLWPKEDPFGEDTPVDGDDPQHVEWLMKKAQERAQQFNIQGVTYRLTQGVIKHIIPAVASTNASVAALCALEVLKLASMCSQGLNNWLNFNNSEGVYTFSYEQERNPDCPTCSRKPRPLKIGECSKFKDILRYLEEEPSLQLKNPSILLSHGDRASTLWMPKVEAIQSQCRDNFLQPLSSLDIVSGSVLEVQDESTPIGLTFHVELVVNAED